MKYKIWFASDHSMSGRKKRMLFDVCKDYEAIYRAGEKELSALPFLNQKEIATFLENKKSFPLDETMAYLTKNHIHVVTCREKEYPKNLLTIPDYPFQLFYKGHLPGEHERLIAVVGARKCTGYGRNATAMLCETLSRQGYGIISGLADGIDGVAHASALSQKGASYGVLGCGVDICYPPKNQRLYEQLPVNGGVLSEYPCGTAPQPEFFPIRNRIISGMSDVVLVMEAREKSGSLITARWALEQGRDVYALPGRIFDQTSDGCHRIISEGAGIIVSVTGLLKDLKEIKNWDYQPIVSAAPSKIRLEKEETLVYSCLDFIAKSVDELSEESGLSVTELVPILLHLCDLKLAEESFIHEYSKI